MINQLKVLKLIKIYSIICDRFEKDLKYTCERFSNNDKQDLTAQEIMAIYLFAVQEEQRFSIKQIHKYACDYLLDWFLKLGSYVSFSNRLSQLSEAFRSFTTSLLEDFLPSDCFTD
jgi:hypothetical protein